MSVNETETSELMYQVVVNGEGQYSLFLAGKEIPRGWHYANMTGTKAECLSYVKDVWTDMTPLSLVNAAPRTNGNPPRVGSVNESGHVQDLVQRLCEGNHPVELSRSASKTGEALQEAIREGYVHIRFTDTKGGTELGIRLDPDKSECNTADFSSKVGNIRLVGSTTLDRHRVLCVAEIDLSTLSGNGHLTEFSSVEGTAS